MTPFDRSHMTFYQCAIVIIALCYYMLKKVTLETRLGVTQSHWKQHHSTDCIQVSTEVSW